MAGVRKDEYAQIFTKLEAVAKVQSIKGSNEIEGIIVSDERIQAIVNQNSAPLTIMRQKLQVTEMRWMKSISDISR